MKKKKFFLLVPLVAMTACTSEDTIENYRAYNDIRFQASVDFTTPTRGTDTSTTSLDSFIATALTNSNGSQIAPLFSSLVFAKEDGYFVSNPVFVWTNEMKLDIYACGYAHKATATVDNTSGTASGNTQYTDEFKENFYVTNEQKTIYNICPSSSVADQVDLVCTKVINQGMAENISLVFNPIVR